MRNYTKLLALFLSVALIAVLFTVAVAAIATPDEATPDEAVPSVSAAETENDNAADPAADEKPAAEILAGGIVEDEDFVITADAYMFGEEKLLLVTVENVSKTAYSIDVKVSYLDAHGKVIDTATQSFDQLNKDYAHNFVFRPGYDFADFTLEIGKTPYSGYCWKSKVEFSYVPLTFGIGDYNPDYPDGGLMWHVTEFQDGKYTYVDDDGNVIPTHRAYQGCPTYYVVNNSGMCVIATSVTMVIFDNNGEIYDVLQRGGRVSFGPKNPNYSYKQFSRVYAYECDDEVGAAEMRSLTNSTGFVAFTLISGESDW